jgi:hypothetical protein
LIGGHRLLSDWRLVEGKNLIEIVVAEVLAVVLRPDRHEIFGVPEG